MAAEEGGLASRPAAWVGVGSGDTGAGLSATGVTVGKFPAVGTADEPGVGETPSSAGVEPPGSAVGLASGRAGWAVQPGRTASNAASRTNRKSRCPVSCLMPKFLPQGFGLSIQLASLIFFESVSKPP